jgi:hypothetical protein
MIYIRATMKRGEGTKPRSILGFDEWTPSLTESGDYSEDQWDLFLPDSMSDAEIFDVENKVWEDPTVEFLSVFKDGVEVEIDY